MTESILFHVDVFDVVVSVKEDDEELQFQDIRCNCDQWDELSDRPVDQRWCRHSASAWRTLIHAIRVDEGMESIDEGPDNIDSVELVKSDPSLYEDVWERFEEERWKRDIGRAFLNGNGWERRK